MQLFRAEEHVKGSGGGTMTPEQMWQLANIWYHDRADAAWQRKTADEAEAIFAHIGLIGDFWRLRV